jgi:hypothetical protein
MVMIGGRACPISDPVCSPVSSQGLWLWLFGRVLRDPRDLAFVRLAFLQSIVFIPLAAYPFIFSTLTWWYAFLYWGLYLHQLGPFVLMLHNTSHRPLFKGGYRGWNLWLPWGIGPLLGQSPESYFAHHMGMHHKENNLPGDLSSTMFYQRDSFVGFMRYLLDFMVLGTWRLVRYLRRKGSTKLLRRFLIGELSHLGLVCAALMYHWQAGVVVFVAPLLTTRFLLMSGNWAQHAFIEPEYPADDFRNALTFINSDYNHRCFNDGYHIGHHIKASRHWLDMPHDFQNKRAALAEAKSMVFHKIDYFIIFLLLMCKKHHVLARYFVQLDASQMMDEDEIVTLMHRRLKAFEKTDLQVYG